MPSGGRKRGHFGLKCTICGTSPAGVHFGGLSCEGCRAFFKRVVEKGQKLECFFGKNCELKKEILDMKNSSKYVRCKACRYQKCLDTGMKVDAIRGGKIVLPFKKGSVDDAGQLDEAIDTTKKKNLKLERETGRISDNDPILDGLEETASLATIRPENVSEFFPIKAQSIPEERLMITSPKLSDIRIGMEAVIPDGLNEHDSFQRPMDPLFQSTMRAVEHAVHCAYREQLESWSDFMIHFLNQKEKPTLADVTEEFLIAVFAHGVLKQQEQANTFASLLPGFSTYRSLPNKHRIFDRFSEVYIMHFSAFVQDDEFFCHIGPQKVHYSRSWLDKICNRDYMRLTTGLFRELKKIDLTVLERYVLLAACLFRPAKAATGPDARTLSVLSAHYMSLLEYMISSRTKHSSPVLEDLRSFTSRLQISHELHKVYTPPSPSPCDIPEGEAADAFAALVAGDKGLIPDDAESIPSN